MVESSHLRAFERFSSEIYPAWASAWLYDFSSSAVRRFGSDPAVSFCGSGGQSIQGAVRRRVADLAAF